MDSEVLLGQSFPGRRTCISRRGSLCRSIQDWLVPRRILGSAQPRSPDGGDQVRLRARCLWSACSRLEKSHLYAHLGTGTRGPLGLGRQKNGLEDVVDDLLVVALTTRLNEAIGVRRCPGRAHGCQLLVQLQRLLLLAIGNHFREQLHNVGGALQGSQVWGRDAGSPGRAAWRAG